MNLFKALVLNLIFKLLVAFFIVSLYFWLGSKLDIKPSSKLDFLTVSSITFVDFILWVICLIYTHDSLLLKITKETSSYWGLSNGFNFPSIVAISLCFNYELNTPFKNLLLIFTPSIIMYIGIKFRKTLSLKKEHIPSSFLLKQNENSPKIVSYYYSVLGT